MRQDVRSRFSNNHYIIQESIGQGGFGEVYKARQKSTDQWVAIKFLQLDTNRHHDKKHQYLKRFERELALNSLLSHPNIVRLLEKGKCDDDLVYAVFEYVDGKTLRQHLNDHGALAPTDAADVMGQMLDALVHAHSLGVVHRDLNPSNVMLYDSGAKLHVKILDFGIGTFIQQTAREELKTLTLHQDLLGTPLYSSPEQLRGDRVSASTDLYVWGLLFLECLTGKPAIEGSSLASIFHQQLMPSDIPLPGFLNNHKAGDLIRSVLRKKTSDRSCHTEDVYQQLRKINFANLISSPSKISARTNQQDVVTDNIGSLDTQITHKSYVGYTQLAEKKQLTAIAIYWQVAEYNEREVDPDVLEAIHQDQKTLIQSVFSQYGAFLAGDLVDTMLFFFG
ncbi:MAG: protein kinase, partial [Cellvibrionales bacterium]|nr:protein kinase [Cellvibrionales bacterium]